MNISVAMAVYNGEKFIREQIDSILPQLGKNDELIISYNPSTDNTFHIINSYLEKDSRIKVFLCEKIGVISNFENAIYKCSNDIIFLADQDDTWDKNKVSIQLRYFEDKKVGGVVHSCYCIDENGNLIKTVSKKRKERNISIIDILFKNPVQGCCLAFRKELSENFLPFPKYIPMHDSWIGLNICKNRKLLYINNSLLYYRQHAGTVTKRKHKKIHIMINDRVSLLFFLFLRAFLDVD